MTVAVSVSNTDCSQRTEHQFMVTHDMVIVAMQQTFLQCQLDHHHCGSPKSMS